MITIAICDDDEFWRKRVRKSCRDYLDSTDQEYDIIEFQSGEEVLEYQGDRVLLLFLDIQMQGMNGLEVMEKLRKNDLFWRIVFVSSYEELRWNTIDIKTLAFLPKPTEDVAIMSCLKTAIRENSENLDVLIKGMDGKVYIKLDEIVYIQAQKNYVDVYTREVNFTGYDSLGYLEEKLRGTTIQRIHKSYLINMQYVESISGGEVKMSNGERITVGRTFYQQFKKSYNSFLKSITVERLKRS